MTKQVPCPTCGKAAPWSRENRWRPFCSERCRLIDLGAWFSGGYRMPADDQSPPQDGVPDPSPDPGRDE